MKVHMIASKSFYGEFSDRKAALERMGHEVTLPHTAETPGAEAAAWDGGIETHADFVEDCFQDSEEKIAEADAVYLLNLEKHGVKGYVGGATLIELYIAFRDGKKIFLENEAPEGIMYDEIMGFRPMVVRGDLAKIR